MDFYDKFESYKKYFEEYLIKYINSLNNVAPKLLESMKYSLFSAGKRIRPVFMIAFSDLFGGNREDIYPFACAVEMIHTYSLIHDDLPCMDDDKFRRNKPCNHIVYGDAIALLAGDALLTQAFEVASIKMSDCSKIVNQVRSINILARCAGSCGMISGQCKDLSANFDEISLNEFVEIYKLKTAMLFMASGQIGAIMGGANEKEINAVRKYSEYIGIIFQLVDDILDDEKAISRLFKDKYEYLKSINESAKEALGLLGRDVKFFEEFTDYVTYRKI